MFIMILPMKITCILALLLPISSLLTSISINYLLDPPGFQVTSEHNHQWGNPSRVHLVNQLMLFRLTNPPPLDIFAHEEWKNPATISD